MYIHVHATVDTHIANLGQSMELMKKKRIRAGHRGVATKRSEEIRALLARERPPDRTEVARYAFFLQEKIEVLRQLDGEILELLEEEGEITSEIEQADTYSQSLLELLLRVKDLEATSGATPTPPTSSSSREQVGAGSARLPKLNLRSFDGDILQWLSFWDSFQAAVHSNTALSDVQKFTYLKSLVERTARDAISGLTLSADNYKEAVDILERRFGNKQKIIAKHMDLLINIDQVSSANHVAALRRLYDQVESNVRSLSALGVSCDSYGSLLSSVLVKKLPPELRLLISRQMTENWDFQGIMKIVREELEARERAATPREGVEHREYKNDRPSTAALVTGTSDGEQSGCCYCRQLHAPTDCDTVTSTEERRSILRRAGRCFACLKRGHLVRECRSRLRCRTCNGKHHSSLCQGNYRVKQGQDVQSKASMTATTQLRTYHTSSLNPGAPPFGKTVTPTTCSLAKADRAILLQTAQVTLYHPTQPERELEVSLIFDSGSQKSYISKAARDILELPSQGRKMLSIMTFGSRSGLQQDCDIVHVGMKKGDHFLKELSLLCVPTICESVVRPPIQPYLEHFPHLELADASQGPEEVRPEVLIGLDHYWEFVTSETMHSGAGPVAVRTTLGWILSGPVPWIESLPASTNLITHVLRVNARSRDCDQQLERQLRKFWDLESLGVHDDEDALYDQFHDVVVFQDGRYEVKLPWKDPMVVVPDNFELSKKRLFGLLKRLRQNWELFKQYDGVIRRNGGRNCTTCRES